MNVTDNKRKTEWKKRKGKKEEIVIKNCECGEKGRLRNFKYYYWKEYWLTCENCGKNGGSKESAREAVEEWNKI